MREIVCVRCYCKKEVGDSWRFATCPDCLAKKRLRRRENKPQQPELKPIRIPFMSFQDYKRYFPNADFKEYREKKTDFEEQSRLMEPNFPQKIFQIPVAESTQHECETFRRVLLGLEKKPSNWVILASHNCRCRLCQIWYSVYKSEWKTVWKGCNIWSS